MKFTWSSQANTTQIHLSKANGVPIISSKLLSMNQILKITYFCVNAQALMRFKYVENIRSPNREENTPPPGFEPGIPKEQAFQACAIPDYAIVALKLLTEVLLLEYRYETQTI